MAITVDTNILIWGVRGICTPGQEDRIVLCKRLFEWFVERHERVVLTADCVEEYLTKSPIDQIAEELESLRERFIILDYNPACWMKAAQIRGHANFVKKVKELSPESTRVSIKSDVRIVATALAHKIEKIYTDDKGVRAIAKRSGLLFSGIPTLEEMSPTPRPKEVQVRPTRTQTLFPEQSEHD